MIPESFIVAIITVFGTAFFTYSSIKNNRKASNYEKILQSLYLPLSTIIRFSSIITDLNINTLRVFFLKIQPIIETNLLYVSEFLITNYFRLKDAIENNDLEQAKEAYEALVWYIDNEFDRLKRLTGLPNKGLFYSFTTLKTSDKIISVLVLLIGIFLIGYGLIFIGNKFYIVYTNPNLMDPTELLIWQFLSLAILMAMAIICFRFSDK